MRERRYKVVLLCTCNVTVGVRTISSVLKNAGIEKEIFFLATNKESYSRKELNLIIRAVKKARPNIIGISSITLTRRKTVQLIKAIKGDKLLAEKKIVWGGMQATAEPDFCLRYADTVAVGECELSFLELVKKERDGLAYSDIPNFLFKGKGGISDLKLKPLINNLDILPFDDYDIEDHKILVNESIVGFRKNETAKYCSLLTKAVIGSYPSNDSMLDLLPQKMNFIRDIGRLWIGGSERGILYTSLARGCPFGCSYCMNNYLKKIYSDWAKIRYRGNKNSIKDLKKIKDRLNHDFIFLLEDDFFLRTEENIEEFSELYKKFINKPFGIQITPLSFSEKKLKMLIQAGLNLIILGVQSGSNRINKEIYHRYFGDADRVLEVARIIHKYLYSPLFSWYDFIIDNPYETEEDILATIDLIRKMPPPFFAKMHNLVLLPKTEMYDKVKRDGLLKIDKTQLIFQDFRRHRNYWDKNFYLNFLLSEISGIATETHLGKVERRNLEKLTDRSFIGKMNKRKRELLSKRVDLNQFFG